MLCFLIILRILIISFVSGIRLPPPPQRDQKAQKNIGETLKERFEILETQWVVGGVGLPPILVGGSAPFLFFQGPIFRSKFSSV